MIFSCFYSSNFLVHDVLVDFSKLDSLFMAVFEQSVEIVSLLYFLWGIWSKEKTLKKMTRKFDSVWVFLYFLKFHSWPFSFLPIFRFILRKHFLSWIFRCIQQFSDSFGRFKALVERGGEKRSGKFGPSVIRRKSFRAAAVVTFTRWNFPRLNAQTRGSPLNEYTRFSPLYFPSVSFPRFLCPSR